MSSDKHLETSVAKLRERGFDPAALPAEAVARLASLRGGTDDLAIANVLGDIAAPESAALLAEMEAGASGPLRREIRRALFRLRRHGIEPAAIAIPPSIEASPQPGDADLSGLLSPADADGARIVWLLKSRSTGGLRRLWAIVSEREGLNSVTGETLSRKELRADRAEIQRRAGATMVDADWHLADFIMCEAYRRTPAPQRVRVGNFLTLRAEMVAASPPLDFQHPIYREFAAELEREPSSELMREPEIGAYKLPEKSLKPFAQEIAQLQQSTLVLNRMQQEERVTAVIERAVEQLITDEEAYRLRRRLEDTAWYFARTGKRAQAGWAAAAAGKIRDGAELKRSTFFQVFVRAQLGVMLSEQQEKQQQEPRLIMTPAEMMRARAQAQARTAQRGRLR